MCGIAGFIGNGTESVLNNMIQAIRHRGPDKQDIYLKDGIGLAHARLSILDTSDAGTQPFWSADKKHVIIYNGELYNYIQLKKKHLSNTGFHFKSSSDTEVLLYLLSLKGENILNELNGMFSFAYYNFETEELLIARDRMGQKPLYYSLNGRDFVFASELKSLKHHPSVEWSINHTALRQYLTFDYVPNPNSIIAGVNKLESGHYLKFSRNGLQKARYYDIKFNTRNDIGFEEAVKTFDNLMQSAVTDRLISDVPLGIFLSGGLDSSAVAYYAQKASMSPIKTFSIGFENKSYDESDYASKVAKHLGTEHHSRIFSVKDLESFIPEVSAKLDEPFADPSIYPTFMLSQFARENVTVSLGGDGSDELLAGYPTFISDRFKSLLIHSPQVLNKLIRASAGLMPVSDKNISLDFKVNQLLKALGAKKEHVHSLWLGSFSLESKNRLLSKQLRNEETGLEIVEKHLANTSTLGDFERTIYTYCKTYLDDDILVKVDRASMLNSLEVRSPFLDYRLVNYVNDLPKKYKLKGNSGKHLLKKCMEGKLPDEIIYRPKKGFGIPVSSWIKDDLKELVQDHLSPSSLNRHGFFDVDYVQKLLNDHNMGKVNNRKEIWNLLIFQMWYSNFMP